MQWVSTASISTAHTNDLIRSAQCKRWMARNFAPKWRGSCSLRIISFNWVEHLLHYLETIDGHLSSCIIIESYSPREWPNDFLSIEWRSCVSFVCSLGDWVSAQPLISSLLFYSLCWRSVALHSIRRIIIIIKSIACNFSGNVRFSFFAWVSLRKCFAMLMRQKARARVH